MNARPVLTLAGRALPDAGDRIRRYCGLPWSGGPPEVWAYHYFDATHHRRLNSPDAVTPEDVLAVAALHPGFTRQDLSFFVRSADQVTTALGALPENVELADADDDSIGRVEALDGLAGSAVGLSLLTKVIHGKRPRLVPMLDRALTEWYQPVTGAKGTAAWRPVVRALRTDLARPANREALHAIGNELAAGLGHPSPSNLRLADIAMWMVTQR